MGIDYAMRYSPKAEKGEKRDLDTADYIPMLEISTYMKGCSDVSASKSRTRYDAVKRKDPNYIDEIMWPLFAKYDQLKNKLNKELFIKTLQTTLEGVDSTVDVLAQEISAMKFLIMSNNSWFEGVDKSDSFEYDGLVINTKIVKEYV